MARSFSTKLCLSPFRFDTVADDRNVSVQHLSKQIREKAAVVSIHLRFSSCHSYTPSFHLGRRARQHAAPFGIYDQRRRSCRLSRDRLVSFQHFFRNREEDGMMSLFICDRTGVVHLENAPLFYFTIVHCCLSNIMKDDGHALLTHASFIDREITNSRTPDGNRSPSSFCKPRFSGSTHSSFFLSGHSPVKDGLRALPSIVHGQSDLREGRHERERAPRTHSTSHRYLSRRITPTVGLILRR